MGVRYMSSFSALAGYTLNWTVDFSIYWLSFITSIRKYNINQHTHTHANQITSEKQVSFFFNFAPTPCHLAGRVIKFILFLLACRLGSTPIDSRKWNNCYESPSSTFDMAYVPATYIFYFVWFASIHLRIMHACMNSAKRYTYNNETIAPHRLLCLVGRGVEEGRASMAEWVYWIYVYTPSVVHKTCNDLLFLYAIYDAAYIALDIYRALHVCHMPSVDIIIWVCLVHDFVSFAQHLSRMNPEWSRQQTFTCVHMYLWIYAQCSQKFNFQGGSASYIRSLSFGGGTSFFLLLFSVCDHRTEI